MRRLAIIAVGALISTATIAAGTPSTSSPSVHSSNLKNLGTAFKSQPSVVPKIDHNDITMGYAGEDVSRKLTISSPSTAV